MKYLRRLKHVFLALVGGRFSFFSKSLDRQESRSKNWLKGYIKTKGSNYEEYVSDRVRIIIWPSDKLFTLEIKGVTRMYRLDFTDYDDLFQALCRDRLFRAIYYKEPCLPVF